MILGLDSNNVGKRKIERFRRAHLHTIKEKLSIRNPLYILATSSLSESIVWTTGLINYIDLTFEEYSARKFGVAKAWHITTKVATALMLELSKPREGALHLFKARDGEAIGNAMDYSLFPSSSYIPHKSVSYKGLISQQHLHSLVCYPTHFSTTGYGVRYLSHPELWAIFGMPDQVVPFCRVSVPLPVQILDALLHPYVHQNGRRPATPPNVTLPTIYNDVGYTTIPHINVKLFHNWYTDVSQSTTSVKSDSAAIEHSIWNLRTTLIWQKCLPSHLDWFRKQLLPLIFSQLFAGFKEYMIKKHFLMVVTKGRVLDWSLIKGGS